MFCCSNCSSWDLVSNTHVCMFCNSVDSKGCALTSQYNSTSFFTHSAISIFSSTSRSQYLQHIYLGIRFFPFSPASVGYQQFKLCTLRSSICPGLSDVWGVVSQPVEQQKILIRALLRELCSVIGLTSLTVSLFFHWDVFKEIKTI